MALDIAGKPGKTQSPTKPGKAAKAGGETANRFRSVLHANLQITVFESGEDKADAVYSLTDVGLQLFINGAQATTLIEDTKREISRDILARLSPRGHILSVRFAPEVSAPSRRLASSVLALTQWVAPRRPNSKSVYAAHDNWETREDDPFGDYTARYSVDSGWTVGVATKDIPPFARKKGVRIAGKTILSYLSGTGAADTTIAADTTEFVLPRGKNDATVPNGVIWAQFEDLTGRVLELRGDQRQINRVLGKQVGQSRTRFDLRLTGEEWVLGAEMVSIRRGESFHGYGEPLRLSARPSREQSELDVQRTELGQTTLADLVEQLAGADSIRDPGYSDMPLYLKAKALILVRPETCPDLARILAGAPMHSRTRQILVRALAAAGSPRAQDALIAVVREQGTDAPALIELLSALGFVDAPTAAAESVLRDLATQQTPSGIASMSFLLLGAMAHNLRSNQPARADLLVQWLSDQLQGDASNDGSNLNKNVVTKGVNGKTAEGVQSTQKLILVLGALGNAGSERSLPLLAHGLTSSMAEVRAAAASSLRFIGQSNAGPSTTGLTGRAVSKPQQADRLLAAALISDSDAGVRREAAFALGFRSITPITYQAQKHALLTDGSAEVRYRLLANLWRVEAAFPEVRALARRVSAHDASKDLRNAADALLKQ